MRTIFINTIIMVFGISIFAQTPNYNIIINSATGCIPNAPHTTQTSFHKVYWKMGIAHTLLNRDLTSIDTVYYINNSGTNTVYAKISGTPSILGVKVWATEQSDMDTTSWNGFTATTMTYNNGMYQADISSNATAFFVQVDDEKDGVDGVITSKPEPINRNYPELFLPPMNVANLSISQNGLNIDINWTNPQSTDYVGTIILANNTGYPVSPLDGTVIYDGTAEQFVSQY